MGLPGFRGGTVSEAALPGSEMLAGENAVVRAGKGSLGGRLVDASVVFSPATVMRDAGRRKSTGEVNHILKRQPI